MINYPHFWQKKGIIACFLWPLSQIYQFFRFVKNCLEPCPQRLPGKIICVGNATVGGSGKTPITIMLAKYLRQQGQNFVIVTNAYKSKLKKAKVVRFIDTYEEVGDESVLLSQYATVIACKNVQESFPYLRMFAPKVIIFDDRMQNSSFVKDLNILVIDENRGFGNEFCIPSGPLREPVQEALDKANLAIIVGNNYDNSAQKKILNELKDFNKPLFNAIISPIKSYDTNLNYLAFCGIGNPERFFESIKSANLNCVEYKIYPDHYNYSDNDIEYLQERAKLLGARLITTKKDHIKFPKNLDIVCFEIELKIENDKEFFNLINNKLFHEKD